jgi:hypothetical protein
MSQTVTQQQNGQTSDLAQAVPQKTEEQKQQQAIQRADMTRAALPLLPTNLQEAWRVSEALARSSLVPKHYQGDPSNVLAAIYMGVDLGISPMQAMREIYVVEGRPSTSALLKVALVRQSPLCEFWRLVESTDTRAVFETKRIGDPAATRHEYTIDDAKKAGLYPGKGGSNWDKRPKLMLRRRCESELCDEVYPDVVKGLRTEDEAQEIEAEVISRKITAPPAPTLTEVMNARAVESAPVAKPEPEKAAPEPKPAEVTHFEKADPQTGEVAMDPVEAEIAAILKDATSQGDAMKALGKIRALSGAKQAQWRDTFNKRMEELARAS